MSKPTKPKVRRRPVEIHAGELRVGDHIVTSVTRDGFVVKSHPVRSLDACPGYNGSHLHVNRTDCYDSRAFVEVVA